MRVIDRGAGEPTIAVIGSVHGDEPAGEKAIERILDEDLEFLKPVRFVVANEEALAEGERFLDVDLNRSFPGDPESSEVEEQLAAEVMNKVEGMKVVDIHTTHSHSEPFATFTDLDEVDTVRKTGVENAVYFPENSGVMIDYIPGVVVEAGMQGSESAVENAVDVVKNFLAAEGVIDRDYEVSSPEVFRKYSTVEGDYEFLAENFREVEEGESYARNGQEELIAEEDFYPVLMSTNGYEGKLGFKAEKIDTSGRKN